MFDVIEKDLLFVLRQVVERPLRRGLVVLEFDSAIELSAVWWELLDVDGVEDVKVFMPFRRDEVGKVVGLDVERARGYGGGDGGFGGDASGLASVELLGEDAIAGRVLGMVGEDGGLVVLRILAETS